jgi:subfamily B ATP-binding cassette protein MsbA
LNQDAPTGVVAKTRHTFGMLALRAKEVWLLIALSVLVALSEGVGMGLLAPVLQYVQYGEKITKDGGFVWRVLAGVLGAFGLKVDLLSLLLLAFVPIVLRQVVFFLHAWYTAKVQARAATRLRAEGFSALVHGDLAFVVREGHGNLVSGLTAQVTRGGMAIFQFVQQISWGVIIGMYVCLLALLSPGLTAITIVAVGLIAVMIKRNVERSRALGAETTVRNNEAYTVIGERISAIRLIKMLGQEDVETRHITGVVRKLEQVQVRIGISRGIIEVTSDPALMLLVFVVVYCGVAFFHASLATLGLFLFVLLRLNEKVKAFNTGRQVLSANIDSLAHVHDLIARAKESRTVLGGSREFEGLKDRIEFRGVSFCYGDEEGEELVLKDVDLTVPRGAQIALVGRSGAGKSTLVDLLPRLREPSTGDILFDGVPSSEFDLRSLRRSIGFMTQDALLFNDTIRSNLAYGLEREPSDDEIDAALRGLRGGASERARDPCRGPRCPALRRPAAAPRAGPGVPAGPGHPDPRRADQRARLGVGGVHPAGPGDRPRREDAHRHRPPAVDRAEVRRDPRPGEGRHRGARDARAPSRAGRRVPPAVRSPDLPVGVAWGRISEGS